MKIGIDITQAQYQGTGVGNYTYNLVKHLLQIDPQNQYLLFGGSLRDYTNLKSIANSLHSQNKIYPFPPTLMDTFFNRFKLPLDSLTGPLDVFHASDWTHPQTQAKTLTTIHDLTILKYPSHQHPKIISTHKRRLDLAIKHSTAIIADSDSTKQDILQYYSYPTEKIHVIHLAASQDFLNFAKIQAKTQKKLIQKTKKKYGLDDYILSVGTREPRKNLNKVIKAYQRFNLHHPNSPQLAIAGRFGWGDNQKPSSNTKLLGFVPQSDLPALYAGAKAFIYPSLYEGFGLPVLEAMTLAVPVITSNRGSLKEVAGKATVLVNPDSSKDISIGIQKALKNSKQLSQLGLKQSKKFSWKKTAEQTLSIYGKIYNSK